MGEKKGKCQRMCAKICAARPELILILRDIARTEIKLLARKQAKDHKEGRAWVEDMQSVFLYRLGRRELSRSPK